MVSWGVEFRYTDIEIRAKLRLQIASFWLISRVEAGAVQERSIRSLYELRNSGNIKGRAEV